MTFLLLPSSRLAIYFKETQTLKTLPIRAEQFVTLQSGGKEYLSVAYLKSVFIYLKETLTNAKVQTQITPIATCSFAKKIECLTESSSKLFASDKFGDIYSIGLDGQANYHNSNLGIPTFLQAVHSANKRYIAVGDEDTRIKIYNLARMHEINSFWFLNKRVPLQLLQTLEETLILLVKNEQSNQESESGKNFVQLYQIATKNIEAAEFSGELLYVSQDVEGEMECKYQKIISSQCGTIYLLKLFENMIKIVTFNLYKQNTEVLVDIQKGDWNHISAQVIKQGKNEEFIIAYGKSTNPEQEFKAVQEYQLQKSNKYLHFVLNQNEYVLVYHR